MSDIKWIKLTTDIFNDEKIRLIDAMPERDAIFVIWIRLLVLAGTTNHCGLIYLNEDLPYTEEMFSTLFNRPLNVVRLALETLQNLKMIHILENQQIEIVNWAKHQYVEGMDKIRAQWQQRQEKHRLLLKEELDKTRLDKRGHVISRDKAREDTLSGKPDDATYKRIIDFLNNQTDKNFRWNNKATMRLIDARLNEGYTIEDFGDVIKAKATMWGNDKAMRQYLRPETLFRPSHFESYLQEWKDHEVKRNNQ